MLAPDIKSKKISRLKYKKNFKYTIKRISHTKVKNNIKNIIKIPHTKNYKFESH